jgi:hypothetical protein
LKNLILVSLLFSGCATCPEPDPCPVCNDTYSIADDVALEDAEEKLSKCLDGKSFMEKQVAECTAKKLKTKKNKGKKK